MICVGREPKITWFQFFFASERPAGCGALVAKPRLRQGWECLCWNFGLWDASLQECAERSHPFSYHLINTEGKRPKHSTEECRALCCTGVTSFLWTLFTSTAPKRNVTSLSPTTAQPSSETWHKCFETGREQQLLSTHLHSGMRTMCATELTWHRLCLPTY